MRKKVLVGAISLAVLGIAPVIASEDEATPAEASEPVAPQHEQLRAMSPEERRAFLQQQHEQFRAQAEASAPPIPPPPPSVGGPSGSGMPTPEERAAEMAELREMSPQDRRAAMREAHEELRAQAEASAPPIPPPGVAGALGSDMPTPEERAAEIEQLRAMSPEDRRAAMREAHEEMRQQAAAAMPPMPPPPQMPEPAAMQPAISSGGLSPEDRAQEIDRMRNMTLEERAAYRNERYQELRQRAGQMGLDLPEQPPWASRPHLGSELMSPEERAAHRETMRGMSPEERAAYREEHHNKMRERAAEAGIELPERPPLWAGPERRVPPAAPGQEEWAQLQERFQAMSAADRETCMAMHQMRQRMIPPAPPMPDYAPDSAGYGYGPGPGYGYGPGQGYGPGYGAWRGTSPGWGYGPGAYGYGREGY